MKFMLVLLLVTFASTLCAQRITPDQRTAEYYRKKSAKQRTVAFVLVGSGLTMTSLGAVAWLVRSAEDLLPGVERNTGASAALALGGLGVMFSSIPFFSSARTNRGRAADVDMHRERAPIMGFSEQGASFPALRLRVSLR